MAPKKAANDDEDTSTRDLINYYKMRCKAAHVPISKSLMAKVAEAQEDDSDLHEIIITDEVGEFGVRAVADAMFETK